MSSKYNTDATLELLCGMVGIKPVPAGEEATSGGYTDGMSAPDADGSVTLEAIDRNTELLARLNAVDAAVPPPDGLSAHWPGRKFQIKPALKLGLNERQAATVNQNTGGFTGTPNVAWKLGQVGAEILPDTWQSLKETVDEVVAEWMEAANRRLGDTPFVNPRARK